MYVSTYIIVQKFTSFRDVEIKNGILNVEFKGHSWGVERSKCLWCHISIILLPESDVINVDENSNRVKRSVIYDNMRHKKVAFYLPVIVR